YPTLLTQSETFCAKALATSHILQYIFLIFILKTLRLNYLQKTTTTNVGTDIHIYTGTLAFIKKFKHTLVNVIFLIVVTRTETKLMWLPIRNVSDGLTNIFMWLTLQDTESPT
ncbi:hypothetical protein ACJX0J_036024, partial [Zea mays]